MDIFGWIPKFGAVSMEFFFFFFKYSSDHIVESETESPANTEAWNLGAMQKALATD